MKLDSITMLFDRNIISLTIILKEHSKNQKHKINGYFNKGIKQQILKFEHKFKLKKISKEY